MCTLENNFDEEIIEEKNVSDLPDSLNDEDKFYDFDFVEIYEDFVYNHGYSPIS